MVSNTKKVVKSSIKPIEVMIPHHRVLTQGSLLVARYNDNNIVAAANRVFVASSFFSHT